MYIIYIYNVATDWIQNLEYQTGAQRLRIYCEKLCLKDGKLKQVVAIPVNWHIITGIIAKYKKIFIREDACRNVVIHCGSQWLFECVVTWSRNAPQRLLPDLMKLDWMQQIYILLRGVFQRCTYLHFDVFWKYFF